MRFLCNFSRGCSNKHTNIFERKFKKRVCVGPCGYYHGAVFPKFHRRRVNTNLFLVRNQKIISKHWVLT